MTEPNQTWPEKRRKASTKKKRAGQAGAKSQQITVGKRQRVLKDISTVESAVRTYLEERDGNGKRKQTLATADQKEKFLMEKK